jgi:hypothetical protein
MCIWEKERNLLIIERTLFFRPNMHAHHIFIVPLRRQPDEELRHIKFFRERGVKNCVWVFNWFRSLTTKKLQMRGKLVVSTIRRGKRTLLTFHWHLTSSSNPYETFVPLELSHTDQTDRSCRKITNGYFWLIFIEFEI